MNGGHRVSVRLMYQDGGSERKQMVKKTSLLIVLTMMSASLAVTKSAYEALATPITYAVVRFLKGKEALDVYDHQTKFNPLLFSG